ncbi:MAG: ATP-binding cassette domain-containing protein, partial [Anaerolineales bacterium]
MTTNGKESNVILSVRNLKKHFPITRGLILQRQVGAVKAVDGISFDIRKGETLGLVGESGCGKSTTGRTILRLHDPTEGEVYFRGDNLAEASSSVMRKYRKDMQIIFQDPYASLNPRMTVGKIVGEPLEVHGIGNEKERRER